MTYMYQIVDFSAASDNSIIHGTIIDSRTCTNLAVITNHSPAQLADMGMMSLFIG